MARGPAKVGLRPPAPLRRPFRAQIDPMPRTCPISWVITSLSVPSACILARSAVSKDITPRAGRNAAAPADAGLRWVGPACPRILPGPSMGTPWAMMRTSSIT